MTAAAPEWTKSESSIEEAKAYLRQGNTIDFFERVSRCILMQKPEDMEGFLLNLIEQAIEGKDLPLELEFQPHAPESHKFMHEKRVSEFIDMWVLALLSARPSSDEERLEFHQQFLKDRIRQRGERGQEQKPVEGKVEESPTA